MQSYIYWALLGMVGYSLTTLFTKLAERSGEVSSLLIGCVSVLCFTYPAQSAPDITQAVSQDCRWDYHNFCSGTMGSEAHF
jgi:uncharacterized membrane protein